jgi:hypothetical protein
VFRISDAHDRALDDKQRQALRETLLARLDGEVTG